MASGPGLLLFVSPGTNYLCVRVPQLGASVAPRGPENCQFSQRGQCAAPQQGQGRCPTPCCAQGSPHHPTKDFPAPVSAALSPESISSPVKRMVVKHSARLKCVTAEKMQVLQPLEPSLASLCLLHSAHGRRSSGKQGRVRMTGNVE